MSDSTPEITVEMRPAKNPAVGQVRTFEDLLKRLQDHAGEQISAAELPAEHLAHLQKVQQLAADLERELRTARRLGSGPSTLS